MSMGRTKKRLNKKMSEDNLITNEIEPIKDEEVKKELIKNKEELKKVVCKIPSEGLAKINFVRCNIMQSQYDFDVASAKVQVNKNKLNELLKEEFKKLSFDTQGNFDINFETGDVTEKQ